MKGRHCPVKATSAAVATSKTRPSIRIFSGSAWLRLENVASSSDITRPAEANSVPGIGHPSSPAAPG